MNRLIKINKLIQVSIATHSNIYRAISALFFSSFQFKASPEGLKNEGMGEVWRGCEIPRNVFSGE